MKLWDKIYFLSLAIIVGYMLHSAVYFDFILTKYELTKDT